MRFKFYSSFLIFIIVTIFAIQNLLLVDIKLFIWNIKDVPLIILIVIPFLTAMIIGLLFGIIKSARYKKELKERDKIIEVYKNEIKGYREIISKDGTPIGKIIVKKTYPKNT